ncbi:hypothetical protein [Salinirubrum litoreum]|uniref:ABC transporter permease n=1 Tax=Salinirubrum litoreum TaxID=1126234 RepID=A0ABD5R707_9EURY|nr:hypothetical protein [Salinirubrum litoreum]
MQPGATQPGLVGAIRIDVRRLHDTWMELAFPRQLDAEDTIIGRWRPETTLQRVAYLAWSALGVPLVAVFYPLLLLGFFVRFNATRLDSATTRLGVVGVVGVSILAWGALSAVAWLRNFPLDGVVALVAASVVATVSAALGVVFARVGGRGTSVLLAYPAGVTALFLPPVVAALYSPTLAGVVFPGSRGLAIWLLQNVLFVGGIGDLLTARFDLQGIGYVAMWVAISVPLGWVLGFVVTLADVIRPKRDETSGSSAGF